MNYVTLGEIINVRGLKGELKLRLFTDFASIRFSNENSVYLSKNNDIQEFKVKHFSQVGEFGYLYLGGIDSVEKANIYREYEVLCDIDNLHKLEDNKYYYYQLVNCDVYIESKLIGKVKRIEENGVQKLLRLDNDKKSLIPFVKALIKSVDVENKKIVLVDMEGLV